MPVAVLLVDDLGVVLDDVGEALAGEHLFPEVGGLQPVRVGRVAAPSFQPLLKGRNQDALPRQLGAHLDLLSSTAKWTMQRFGWKSSSRGSRSRLVLRDGVGDRLLGEAVLQLEGGDRQPVDEEDEIERAGRLVRAVAELAGDAEDVGGVVRRRPGCCPGVGAP